MLKEPVMETIDDQRAFNRRRWLELVADPFLSKLDRRVETDRYGHPLLMTVPPSYEHGGFQSGILLELRRHFITGDVITECPVSTSEGIKFADAIWISPARKRKALRNGLLELAPEICVEVLSPSNSRGEMTEKKRLYFEAGAKEVWLCDLTGRLHFYLAGDPEALAAASVLAPGFPRKI